MKTKLISLLALLALPTLGAPPPTGKEPVAKPAAEVAKPAEKPVEKPAEKPVSPTAERHEAINKVEPVALDAGTAAPTVKGKEVKKKATK